MDGLTSRTIPTNGIHLHAVEAGPADGPLVVFLHGYPEFWYAWRKQIAPFAAAGFRVLAPDLRGYNLSDKPKGISSYRIDHVARDVLGLIDEAGRDKAFIAGHDWGGVAAWWLGMAHPDRVEKLGLLNIPHPAVARQHILKNGKQRRRSWYIFFFQLPWLPERAFKARNFTFAAKSLRGSARRGTFTDEDLARYREAWRQPGAARSMLNWYRAAPWAPTAKLPSQRVTVPTLLLWGAKDIALGRELAQPSIDRCDDGRLVFIEEAGHFVQHEEPERVNGMLGDFFS
ncbi:MAG TPA: alpha/beta hydrolase [Thermoanaerobaculia bacterium]|nr:alpha/beta hydrolase [Thermoanaerobaculia bacterium]